MSVTAVPLRPVKKGAITRLWVGIAAVALAGGGLAWAGTQGVAGETQTAGAAEPGAAAAPAPQGKEAQAAEVKRVIEQIAAQGTTPENQKFLDANAKKPGVKTLLGGVQMQVLKAGTGASPTIEDYALVNYKGSLSTGKQFDAGERAPFPLSGVVPGFTVGLMNMQKGGSYRIWIPSQLGYGPEEKKNQQTGEVVIPANALLVFDVEMLDWKTGAEVAAQQQQMMQQLQAQQGAAAPGQ